jgi:hypothetical protein
MQGTNTRRAEMGKYTTKQLLECVSILNDSYDENSDVALTLALNELEKRMPESEFVALCDSL